MRRIIALGLALILALSMVSCASPKNYTLTVHSNAHQIENELKQHYQAGEEVTLKLDTVTEQYYVVTVNGEEQQRTDMDEAFTYFTFVMPSEDAVVDIKAVSVSIPSDSK